MRFQGIDIFFLSVTPSQGRYRIVLLSIWDAGKHSYSLLGVRANVIHITNVFSELCDVVGFRRLRKIVKLFQNRFNIRRQCAIGVGRKYASFILTSLLLG